MAKLFKFHGFIQLPATNTKSTEMSVVWLLRAGISHHTVLQKSTEKCKFFGKKQILEISWEK